MQIAFRETSAFTSALKEYFGSDEHYRLLQNRLAENPTLGRVVPGIGPIRKCRHADPRRGKGTRSGLRVLYIYVPEANYIGMLDVYDKDEAEDLSAQEKSALKKIADKFRQDLLTSI